MCTIFPDISYHLSDDSSCFKAVKLNGGRNLAQVLLDVYNAIPDEQATLKENFKQKVESWLRNDVLFKAPELFPSSVWKEAGWLMLEFFTPHLGTDWEVKCSNIFRNIK